MDDTAMSLRGVLVIAACACATPAARPTAPPIQVAAGTAPPAPSPPPKPACVAPAAHHIADGGIDELAPGNDSDNRAERQAGALWAVDP